MDLPEQALEMFNRFLAGKTFHDVVLPTDGTLYASPFPLPSLHPSSLPLPYLLVEDIMLYLKYHRHPPLLYLTSSRTEEMPTSSCITPHLSPTCSLSNSLSLSPSFLFSLSPSPSHPNIQLNSILFVRANRSLVRTEQRHDVHD